MISSVKFVDGTISLVVYFSSKPRQGDKKGFRSYDSLIKVIYIL